MVELTEKGVFLVNGTDLYEADESGLKAAADAVGADSISPDDAARSTMAYGILKSHNTSGDMDRLRIKFDMLTSHDITFVGIIQTARASGLDRFPIPYVLTNCHNSLCAVGGTINEDDHVFGLSCAKRYGGVYVPPHQAVIHQFARERLAACGRMILGSDSHTRYGALGTMAMGEGGPELVKQLLSKTYDINRPDVICIYLTGEPVTGVGPQDVALAIIAAVFDKGYVNNKVMEFVGPGVSALSADFRIGVDVMTTETTCLSSIWRTDDRIAEFYDIHGRAGDYKELNPGPLAYYDGAVKVDLSTIRPMIAMPFHPSNAYEIEEVVKNPGDVLRECEERAKVSLGEDAKYNLTDKLRDGKLYVDQGIIAGCAGGGFENICAAADILEGKSIGSDAFTLSVYPASMPVYMELIKNGSAAKLMATGAVLKTAFCGPCFGAGDTPANGDLSIRHSTRNFPNREGSKLQNGQIASVALMDARSIAATAANKGRLTPATEVDIKFTAPKYFFDSAIYDNRVFDSKGVADPSVEVRFGPNIKDWPSMPALTENLLLKVASVITDPVTTTDELIPSGETSSYRSNPLGLAEFALSRKDPEYVGRAKTIHAAEQFREEGADLSHLSGKTHSDGNGHDIAVTFEFFDKWNTLQREFPEMTQQNTGIGSVIYATKPGDGSAREQAASCQKVLGGWANIAREYATKRYRSNLINWGMLPFIIDEGELPFGLYDYIYIPGIANAIKNGASEIDAYCLHNSTQTSFKLRLGALTDDERQIILKGCLINYYRD